MRSGEAHFGISTAKTAVLGAQAWSARLGRVKDAVNARADIVGNAISVEDEEYKLRTIVETAEQVWG